MTTLARTPDYFALLQSALDVSRQKNATAVEAALSIENGFNVDVHEGDVENVEHHTSQSLTVTVYRGQRKGSASSTDFSHDSIQKIVEKASTIAGQCAEDPFAGLADPAELATSFPDISAYHPWDITPAEAIQKLIACEQEAKAYSSKIAQSESLGLSTYQTHYYYANSNGFLGHEKGTNHTVQCSLIAKEKGQMMRDGEYTTHRNSQHLQSFSELAHTSADKAVKRLGARKLKTQQCAVLFEASVARSLIRHFLSAISGSNLYQKSSFLFDKLHQPIFPSWVSIHQDPFIPEALGSTTFDYEGVRTRKLDFVKEGVLNSYMLDSYSARKLYMKTTGNAGGAWNVMVKPSVAKDTHLLKQLQQGLWITELFGQGVNLVTGDYSRGAFGFWVENGEIQYPVNEITIAGLLPAMFQQILAIGADQDFRSSVITGSILVDNLTVGGL